MTAHRSLYPVAIHLFLRSDDRVLLLRRFNTGYEDGNYSVVAGHVELGETVISAAIREAREEVGVVIEPGDISITGVMHRLSNEERIDFFAECSRWEGTPGNLEPEKCDELLWALPSQLPANTIPYIRSALSVEASGMWFEQFGWPVGAGQHGRPQV